MTDAKKPWEQQYASTSTGGSEPWKQDYGAGAADAPPAPRGLKGWGQEIGDSAIALGTGVAQGVKMISDAAGAGNAVSRLIGQGIQAAEDLESDHRKAQKQERAGKIKAAEDSGSTWEEVKAYAGSFADAPIDTTLNAVGSVVPTLAAAALTGGGSTAAQLAARAAPMAIGAVQGAGAVKGGIYDAVEQRHLEAGATPEQAAQRADVAQAYSGDNLGSIATGAGLGVLAGSTGAEAAVRRLAGAGAVKQAADATTTGIAKGAALGVAKEAPVEAVQGGQERLAANLAEQGEGFDTPTMRGVAGQAALEGLAAAPLGGGLGAMETSGRAAGANANVAGNQNSEDAEQGSQAGGGTNLVADPMSPSAAGITAQDAPAPASEAVAPAVDNNGLPASSGVAVQNIDTTSPESDIPKNALSLAENPVGAPVEPQSLNQGRAFNADTQGLGELSPSQAMGLRKDAGQLEGAAALAVDSGASQSLQTAEQQSELVKVAELGADEVTGEIGVTERVSQIQDRLGFLAQMGSSQGWDQRMVQDRDALQSELSTLVPELQTTESTLAEPRQIDMLDTTDLGGRIKQLEAQAAAADAEVRDWVSREYKQNAKPLPSHEAKGGPGDVSEANEQRRLKAISDAQGRAIAARAEIIQLQEQANAGAAFAGKSSPAFKKGAKTDGTQTPQAQQAKPQQPSARAAPGQAVTLLHAAAASPAGTPVEKGLSHGSSETQNNGGQAGTEEKTKGAAAAAAIGQAGNASRQAEHARKLEASERWMRMSKVERQVVTANASGLNPMQRKNLHTRSWADMTVKTRAALLDDIAPVASVTNQKDTKTADGVKLYALETGTLGIPRAEMPQVPTQSHGGLVKHLNAQGIAHETTTVDAAALKPTQAEYSPSKVAKAKQATGDRAVIVSSDGHIIDGHHQAMAAAEDGKHVKAIVLDAPVDQALEAVKASPSVQKDAQEPASKGEFPVAEASASYSGISHSGGQRGKADAAEFEQFIATAREAAVAVAETAAQKAAVEKATESLRTEYIEAYRRLMNVRSSTYSAYVAGRSGLNAKQANRRNDALSRAQDAFSVWQKDAKDRVHSAALQARTDEQKQADRQAKVSAAADKAQRVENADRKLIRKILAWKKGGDAVVIGKSAARVTGVNLGRDGYPSSVNLEPTDGSTLSDNKFDLADFFRRPGVSVPESKRRVRALVDAVRAEDAALVFRRGEPQSTGFDVQGFLGVMNQGQQAFSEKVRAQAVEKVQGTVDAIRKAWANGPDVVVAYDMADPAIPEAVRQADLQQRSGGASGEPEGFYHGGKAYLLARQLKTPNDAARVLFHEALGHHGLRGAFGKELDGILDQIATMRKADVDAKIQEYGLRDGSLLDRRIAAEEVLAEMAQSNPQIGFVKRAVAAIRTWLRNNVPGFQSLKLTDSEIINSYLLPARAWVERAETDQGAQQDGLDLAPAASRSPMKSVNANVARGREALATALNDKTTVHRAMFRNGLGWVDFVWGSEGAIKPNGRTKGGMGLVHILEARQRKDGLTEQESVSFLGEVVDAIALGAEFNRKEVAQSTRVGIEHDKTIVWLTKNNGSNAWIVTGYEKVPSGAVAGRATTAPTLEAASLTRDFKEGTESIVKDAGDLGNIMFSRSKLADLKDKGMTLAHNALSHPGKVSLWDKTVGTMRHVSERYPAFKPVFESAQQFIDDVSSVANQAAQVAPRLIPRVETLGDMLGKNRKRAISVGDNQAIGKALNGGTLDWGRDQHGKAMPMDDLRAKYKGLTVDQKAEVLLAAKKIDPRMMAAHRAKKLDQFETIINQKFESTILKAGAAFNHKELKEYFNLTDQQISLYDEARATVDKSLDITARAEMLRTLGRDWDGMRDIVMDAPTLTEAWKLLDDELEHRAKQYPDTRDRLATQMQQLSTTLSKAQELMDHGYMPLQRFGKYTLDVVDQAGERLYYGMFESKTDSHKMLEAMRREFPDAKITQGTMNEHKHKLMAGITPETAELFGSMLGLDAEGNQEKDKAFQEYLKLAKNNHSAMKRLIHRKGILGYSDDVGRVLASFVYSNARVSATGLNAGKMETAINDLNTQHKEEGELGEIAAKLRSYIQDPQEEGQAMRGMLFAQYLGGSLASAAVNMTQPFAVTLPWLSQYGGIAKASKYMSGALRDMVKRGNKYEPDLAHALRMAEDDGVVSPQEIHQLMAQARGAGGLRTGDGTKVGDARAAASNAWEKVKVAWGQPFALAEQFNRRSTFIAAYRLARDNGMDSPAQFARDAVVETQFLYTKANKPQWARGAVGGTLFTFKTYSVSFLELMQRTWNAGEAGSPERAAGRRAVGWAMLMLMLMGGAGGMPFVEDVEDLVDGTGQMMGYNLSSKQWRKDLMREVLGAELAEFMDSGLSGMPGAPIDVSGRLGMGNLIPGTGLLLSKQSNTRDVVEMMGPAGDLVARGFSGAKSVVSGVINRDAASIGRGAMEVMPNAVRNLQKGVDMAASGIYKDTKGYKVVDTSLDEALWKAIGFQPRSVAEVQESNSFMQRAKSFYTQTSNDIRAQWAKALFEKDEAGVVRVRERLAQWNAQNPDQPIRINMPDIWKRARQMGKDRTARIADTAPKALRQQMREFAARE